MKTRQFLSLLPFPIALLALAGCCSSTFGCDDPPLGPVIHTSFFDTIAVPGTLHPGDSLTASVAYPSGCNHFGHIDQTLRHDTLMLLPIFFLEDASQGPCAHGPGLDTMRIGTMPWLDTGTHWISYPRGDALLEKRTDTLTVPVVVR